MPAREHIYGSLTQLSFVGPSLEKLYDDIKNLKSFNLNQDQGVLPFRQTIALKNIDYNYPNASRTAIKTLTSIYP